MCQVRRSSPLAFVFCEVHAFQLIRSSTWSSNDQIKFCVSECARVCVLSSCAFFFCIVFLCVSMTVTLTLLHVNRCCRRLGSVTCGAFSSTALLAQVGDSVSDLHIFAVYNCTNYLNSICITLAAHAIQPGAARLV